MDTDAQIYLQRQRGHFQEQGFRSFRTFNFGNYQAENREPIGNLLALNDETLMPQCSHKITVNEPMEIILLPLAGAIEINDGTGALKYVDSGELLSLIAKPGKYLTLTNPYPNQTVNYLQIRFLRDNIVSKDNGIHAFDLTNKNTLIPISDASQNNQKLAIGKFQGRQDGLYITQNPTSNIFIFTIEGAFEVQNRLLEKQDGLMLKNVWKVEFEALSSDAIILVIEF